MSIVLSTGGRLRHLAAMVGGEYDGDVRSCEMGGGKKEGVPRHPEIFLS